MAFLDRRRGGPSGARASLVQAGGHARQIHNLAPAIGFSPRHAGGTNAAVTAAGRGPRLAMQEARSRPHDKFLADAMLGKLARWLRILGYDTAYERVIADDELIRRVLREGRWLLTRDRYLAQRRVLRGRLTLLYSDDVVDQLRELASDQRLELKLGPETASRCAACNARLIPVPKSQAVQEVPPFVAIEQDAFARCPQCGRLFWPGSHWQRLTRELDQIRHSPQGSDA